MENKNGVNVVKIKMPLLIYKIGFFDAMIFYLKKDIEINQTLISRYMVRKEHFSDIMEIYAEIVNRETGASGSLHMINVLTSLNELKKELWMHMKLRNM